jgi:hypothetical protein
MTPEDESRARHPSNVFELKTMVWCRGCRKYMSNLAHDCFVNRKVQK